MKPLFFCCVLWSFTFVVFSGQLICVVFCEGFIFVKHLFLMFCKTFIFFVFSETFICVCVCVCVKPLYVRVRVFCEAFIFSCVLLLDIDDSVRDAVKYLEILHVIFCFTVAKKQQIQIPVVNSKNVMFACEIYWK